MNWPKISRWFLYLLGIAMVLRNLFLLYDFADVFADPNTDLQVKGVLFAQSLFWIILGLLLIVAAYKRSRFIVGVTLAAVLYLIITFVVMIFPLAKFYLVNTSGLQGLKIMATIAGTNLPQIVLAFATFLIAKRLHKLGHVT